MYQLENGEKVHFVNVFDLDNVDKLKEFQQTVTNRKGVVYAIEVGDLVKIGCTRKPYDRVKTHYRNLKMLNPADDKREIKLGTIVMTDPCFNYYSFENRLHRLFKKLRFKGTELFKVNLDAVVVEMVKQFECDVVNEDQQVELLFSNLLDQLHEAMTKEGSMLGAFAQALAQTGNQLAEAEERINKLEEALKEKNNETHSAV